MVNTIKILGMLLNIVYRQVYKNIIVTKESDSLTGFITISLFNYLYYLSRWFSLCFLITLLKVEELKFTEMSSKF